MDEFRLLLSRHDLAALLGVSLRTIDTWAGDPSIDFPRPRRIGKRRVMWPRKDVEAWVDSQPEIKPKRKRGRPRTGQ